MTTTLSIPDSGPLGNYHLTCNPHDPRIVAAAQIWLEWLASEATQDDPRHAVIEAALAAAGFQVTNSRNGRRIEARRERAA